VSGEATRRGSILIDQMIAVSIIGIAAAMLWGHFDHYADTSRRAMTVDGVARVLDLEMERVRECRNRACIDALGPASEESDTWARVELRRDVRAGPDGTVEVTIVAESPHLRSPRSLIGLVRFAR